MANFGAAVASMLEALIDIDQIIRADSWIPEEHMDRLRQYEVFRALDENRLAALLRDPVAKKKLRGYGDYGLIVETSRDALLGDRQAIEVPGSNDDDNVGARARLLLLERWGNRERWSSKLYQAETDAATVGDSVYELRPDGTRLRLRVHSPEEFFPVWDSNDGDFSEAYLAWEEHNTGQYLPDTAQDLAAIRTRDGGVVLYRRHYRLLSAEDAPSVGILPGARDFVCVVTAGWYRIEVRSGEAPGWNALEVLRYETLSDGTEIEDQDTGFGEVPLFYVPNRESTRQPWGLPEGDRVLQILLDAAQDHTDLKENTFHNAFPPLYDENATATPARPGTSLPSNFPAEQTYKPGRIYNGRKLGVVDTSKGNALLLDHERFLIDKALINSRTTLIGAGRLEAGEIPSGVALMIALLPLLAKTLPKRQTRKDKIGMMLKYVLRWYRANGDPTEMFEAGEFTPGDDGWPAGVWDGEEAYPIFGSIVPVDRKQVSEMVQQLVNAGAISHEVATQMLIDAGFPIDDAAVEVERIRAEAAPPGFPGSDLGGEIVIPGITTPNTDAAP